MTRIWEFSDNKAIPSDLVREQDFILKLRRMQRLGTPHFVVNLILNSIESLAKNQKALEAVESRLKEFARVTNGTYADMSNGDAFIVWEETADAQNLIDSLIKVMLPEGHGAEEIQNFLLVYHLPVDYTKLRERANHYIEVVRAVNALPTAVTPGDALKSEAARGPLTPWTTDQVGRLVSSIDLKPYTRSQPIYRLGENGKFEPVREEHFVSFDDLRRERFPKIEIVTPEHLFLALCEIIDQRLLHSLTENPSSLAGRHVNLNISVAAVMSAAFAQFVLNMPVAKRANIAFEIHRGDLLQDFVRTLGAFEVIRKEGFKIAVDGITPDIIPYMNLGAFDADFIKINVARERAALLKDATIREALAKLPVEKLIFFRCDSEAALQAGRECGVTLFQGWHIDDKLNGPALHHPVAD